jgi:hypothetical protein
MNINNIEEYYDFERQNRDWFDTETDISPISYFKFLEDSIGPENIRNLWLTYNTNPISIYFKYQPLEQLENATEVNQTLEGLISMIDELDALDYFIDNIYDKQVVIQLFANIIEQQSYTAEEGETPETDTATPATGPPAFPSPKETKDKWLAIFKHFFRKIEEHIHYHPYYVQKDIYLELVSDLVIHCIAEEGTYKKDVIDIYLSILSYVFFSKELETGYIAYPEILDTDNLRDMVYLDIMDLLSLKKTMRSRFIWEYITSFKKRGKSYNECLAYLCSRYHIDELTTTFHHLIILREKLPKMINIRRMRQRIPLIRYNKLITEELKSLPPGQIVSTFPGGQEYHQTMATWHPTPGPFPGPFP